MRRIRPGGRFLHGFACLLAVLLCGVLPASGPEAGSKPPASQWLIRRWTSQEGLPGNIVPALLQSRSGRIWIGTLDGLCWSDGLSVYPIRPKDYPGAPEGGIWSLHEDHEGTLWIGGHNGRIHALRRGRFEDLTPPDIGTFNVVVAGAGDGSLWAGSPQGLWRWDGQQWRRPDGAAGRLMADIKALSPASGGGLWLGTRNQGVWRLEAGGALTHLPLGREDLWVEVSRVSEDREGRLWVGTRGGGIHRMEAGGLRPLPGLPPDLLVESLMAGRDGVTWVGTSLGVFRVTASEATPFQPSAFGRYARIPALMEDREGSLWFGTWQDGLINLRPSAVTLIGPGQGLEGGLFSLAPRRAGGAWVSSQQGEVRVLNQGRLSVVPGLGTHLPGNLVGKDLLEDRGGTLWIGTTKGLHRFNGRDLAPVRLPGPTPAPAIRTLHQAQDGTLWVGSQQGLFRYQQGRWTAFTEADGLSNGYILSLQSEPEGRLLVGTNGGGLCMLDRGRFTVLRKADGLPSDIVFRGHRTADGAWWFGSTGGLFRLMEGRVQAFTRAQDVLPLTVYQVLEAPAGTLWLTSSQSVLRIAAQQALRFLEGGEVRVKAEVFDARDGLPVKGPTSVGQSLTLGGELLVATMGGVARFQPEDRGAPPLPAKVEILEIRAHGALHLPGGEIRLPSRSNLEIRYAAHSPLGAERMGFRYLLEGFDREWQTAGDRRSAFFTRVPPGTYRFRVMAGQGDAVWQEAPPLTFVVQARWFERLEFRVGVLLLAGAVGWGFVRWRNQALHRRAEHLERLVDQRTGDLKAAKADLERANVALESKVAARTVELREALRQALAADEAKALLLARMSHEFRTPLNHMLLYAELLRQEWPEGFPRPDLDFGHIQSSGKALEAVLSDLLDYAELASGGLKLRPAPFQPQVLLDRLRHLMAPQAKAKRLAFLLVAERLPEHLVGDADRCFQVLRDLTSNAIKFTPQGEVRVEARWDEPSRRLEVSVLDTGPGLPPERQAHPFEALEPGDGSLTRRHPGTGLGLALASGLVALMGGTLTWRPRPEGGTCFSASLPFQA